MLGIMFLLGYGLPVIILMAAAAIGVFSARYFRGHPKSEKSTYATSDPRMVAAVWLAIAFPFVAIISLILPTVGELQKTYGALIGLLWLWALCSFVIGVVFGWSSCEHAVAEKTKKS